ncbi:ParB/RepB/Spo0J family partition protein [Streptomyces sp. NPDC006259]|uniref:ParB/RepB/Spo0J family partition protein n=1 Tax=Streptomyces sp. NPDC006259 TaxID=3364740 RepID=UPI0036856255
MSKAEQLGAGRFGGGARTVSARRQAVAAATGVPTEGVAPPAELPVDRVSLNPDNPRSTLGDLTDLAGSLKTHGQKVAITVMNRDAYLKANPSQEANLEPDTTHVVVDGSSRLAAAREAGLATIKVMVSDDQGGTAEELLESALVANIHRNDLEELDEARALQRLLVIHGSQRALAKRLHRSQGWVSQRLSLLNLTPELQARIGEEPIDLLRAVGNKPADEQATALAELKSERTLKESKAHATASRSRQTAEDSADGAGRDPAGDYGVITTDAQVTQADVVPETVRLGDYAVITADSQAPSAMAVGGVPGTSESIPEPRADSPAPGADANAATAEQRVRKVPFDRPGELALLLDKKIESDDVFFALLQFLSANGIKRDRVRMGELARSLAVQAAAPVD